MEMVEDSGGGMGIEGCGGYGGLRLGVVVGFITGVGYRDSAFSFPFDW